jgi:aminoglycoside 2''-phosphotransferase
LHGCGFQPRLSHGLDADYYRGVIQACFPTLSVRSVVFLAEGWGSTAWEVNGDYVFRFPKRPEIAPGLLKEVRILPVLAGTLPLRIPQFEYVWRGGAQHEGLVVGYPKIPGVPMGTKHLAFAGAVKLSRQLGEFLTALHSFPAQRAVALGVPQRSPAQWRRHYDTFYGTVRQRVFPLLGTQERRRNAEMWEGFLENEANFRFTPVLIHADLSGEHILFDPANRSISGIIDWEDATVGDPALDFTGLLGDYGRNLTLQVLASYDGAADEGIVSRARFYDAIVPCYEVLYGLDVGLPHHVSSGLEGLRNVELRTQQ